MEEEDFHQEEATVVVIVEEDVVILHTKRMVGLGSWMCTIMRDLMDLRSTNF